MQVTSQWTERPPGVREVMGSIPVGDSYFFLHSGHVDQSTFHISLPSSKFTIFIRISQPCLIVSSSSFDLSLCYYSEGEIPIAMPAVPVVKGKAIVTVAGLQ